MTKLLLTFLKDFLIRHLKKRENSCFMKSEKQRKKIRILEQWLQPPQKVCYALTVAQISGVYRLWIHVSLCAGRVIYLWHKCGDNIQMRWASLQFSDVKFPRDNVHQKLLWNRLLVFTELSKI